MIYQKFGSTNWKVSALGLGCWNIGNQYGELTDSEVSDIVNTAIDSGINLFDLADVYGEPYGLSEIRLGKIIHHKRNNLFLVSKIGKWGNRHKLTFPLHSYETIRLMAHACLGRLQTNYIDLLLCHDQSPEHPEVYIEGFERLKEEGFIREYGISTDSYESLVKFHALSNGACKAVELGYSLLNREPEKNIIPFCQKHNIGILVKRPLEGGILTGRFDEKSVFTDAARKGWNADAPERQSYLDKIKAIQKLKTRYPGTSELVETAMRYIISHEAGPVAVAGATRPQQAISNAEAAAKKLTSEEIKQITKILEKGE